MQSDSTAFPKLPKNVCLDDSQIINLVTDGGPNRFDFFTHFCKSHKKVLAYICKKQSMYTIVSPSSMQKITSYTNIMSV